MRRGRGAAVAHSVFPESDSLLSADNNGDGWWANRHDSAGSSVTPKTTNGDAQAAPVGNDVRGSGPFVIVGIGELLWDVFPDGRRELGGAVANLVYHASLLGDRGVLASRVGRDGNGDLLVARLRELGVDGRHLQRDASHPTATVDVALNDGAPSYTIHESVAFDYPELDAHWQGLAARTDAVTFGTLAQRTAAAATVIRGFVAACPPHCLRPARRQFAAALLVRRPARQVTAGGDGAEAQRPGTTGGGERRRPAGRRRARHAAAPAGALPTSDGLPDARRTRLSDDGSARWRRSE